MSWLKKSLMLAVLGLGLMMGGAPKEAHAVGGEYSYQTFYLGWMSFDCATNAVKYSSRITTYGYQGYELSYYAYLYGYYGYIYGNSQYAYYTEGKAYWSYQACGAEWQYFGGNDWWYYAAAYSGYQYTYCYYVYTYE